MDVAGHAVSVGDWLRCVDDGWEGQVLELIGDEATLLMTHGDVRACTSEQLYWNWWQTWPTG